MAWSDEASDEAKRAHVHAIRMALASLAYPSADSKQEDAVPACCGLTFTIPLGPDWGRFAFALEFTNGVKLSGLLKDLSVE